PQPVYRRRPCLLVTWQASGRSRHLVAADSVQRSSRAIPERSGFLLQLADLPTGYGEHIHRGAVANRTWLALAGSGSLSRRCLEGESPPRIAPRFPFGIDERL